MEQLAEKLPKKWQEMLDKNLNHQLEFLLVE